MLHGKVVHKRIDRFESSDTARGMSVEHIVVAATLPAVAQHIASEIGMRHSKFRCSNIALTDIAENRDLADSTIAIVDPCGAATWSDIKHVRALARSVILCANNSPAPSQPDCEGVIVLDRPNTEGLMRVLGDVIAGRNVKVETAPARQAAGQTPIAIKPQPALTKREAEVFDGIIKGRRYKQIAFDLGLSEATVKVHAFRIFDKTGIHSKHRLASLHAAG